MKKFFLTLFLIIAFVSPVMAEEGKVLTTGILIQEIPKEFFGMWRVSSTLTSTNSQGVFKTKGTDFWNISRKGDVIYLENPFSGAKASISVCELSGNYIKFEKIGNYDGQKLTDTVQINIKKESFSGLNTLKLDTFSDIDNHVIKSNIGYYKLYGEKISGTGLK